MSTAIVTGGTKKDVDAMAVLALNLQQVSPGFADELVIFHDGISKKKQELINKIMPTRFIRYKCPISWFKLMSNRTIRYFSPMVFCKYECIKLLEDYDTVVWTDYDVVIRADISELKSISQQGLSIIVNKDTKLREMFYRTIENVDMKEYDMESVCFTTPLFILNRKLKDYMSYYQWCYETTKKYIKYLYLPEQCVLSLMMQKFGIAYEELDMETYCYHPKQATERTKILHAYGQPKFWNGLHNEQWNKYYKRWQDIQRE